MTCPCIRPSLDHLVGAADERQRDRQPERSRGLEIDDQLNFCGLLDRKIDGPLALENPTAASCLCIGPRASPTVQRERPSR